jgi:iron complex outermembrane receptor protein
MSLQTFWRCPLGLWTMAILLTFLTTALIAPTAFGEEEEDPWATAQQFGKDEKAVSQEPEPEELTKEEIDEENAALFKGAEIVEVTANRRTENLQKAAASVTALNSSFIEDVGLTDFKDIQKFTPNLQIIPQGDSRSTSIRIRGIGSVGNNAGIDPSVGVFIDGVYQGRAGMSVLDLLDVQSVEILRGPQGTLYGKNTAAGAIKVSSKKPNNEPSAMFEFVTGEYNDLELRFTGNLPIVEDRIATRLTGYRVSRDGYETNVAPQHDGENINDTAKWGVRSSTLVDVNDDVSFLVRADYAEIDEDCCAPDVWEYGSDPTAFPPSLETLATQAGVTLVPAKKGDRDVTANIIPRNEVEVGGISLEADVSKWDHTFTWLTAYRNYQSDSKLDADFSQLDVLLLRTEVEYDQGSMELRMASLPYQYIDYVAGLYGFYSDLDTHDLLQFRDQAFAPFVGQQNNGTNQHRTTSIAGYADSNLYVSELWGDDPNITFTGGVRVGWERKDHEGSQLSQGPLGNFPTAISGPDSFSNQDDSDDYVTGRAILKWEPVIPWDQAGDTMLYASFASGYKSAGYNQLRTNGQQNDESVLYFRPEKSKSYELGLRSQWFERMLTFNITGYYTDYEDFQTQVFDGLGIRVLNAGSFHTYGFEADITLALLEGWITIFGVGYTKTEYTDFDQGPCRQGNPLGCEQDLEGERLDSTPEWNISLVSTYEREVPRALLLGYNIDVNWFVLMDYNYQSNRYLNVSLDPVLRVDPTHVVGLRAGLREPDARWEVNVFVTNLTDEDVWAIGFDVPTVQGYAAFQAPPRTIGGTVRVKF